MRYAVFFRNLNLGRANCPSRRQFEQAFLDAGAQEAASFLTNGTLVFSARARASPQRLLQRASQLLEANCGLVEPGFIRSLPELVRLSALDPFAAVDRSTVYACCVSFLPPDVQLPGTLPLITLPLMSSRGDVEVLRFTNGEALTLSRKIGKSPGSPNAFLEKLLSLPATTRSWNTVTRLVGKFA
jgi:uncharacterized protein (DUF1697 family)